MTDAQKRTLADIRKDMRSPCPMNRLIQGDVGCGKTVVALLAMLDAVGVRLSGRPDGPYRDTRRPALHKHARSVESSRTESRIAHRRSQRQASSQDIASGETDIVIGTHALIQEGVKFKKLGLAVIDEQHKFGVMQRALLRKKGMTAGCARHDRNTDTAFAGADPLR